MTKIRKKNVTVTEISGSPLDTLAQLTTKNVSNSVTLYKRAVSKFITNSVIFPLIDLNSTRKKAYWSTFHCVKTMLQDMDGNLTAKYCKQRWCVVCNRIRTAKLIKGYLPEIQEWTDPRFVTLTYGVTVTSAELPDRIENMLDAWRHIMKSNQMRKWGMKGIRKLEVTYSKGKFHAHFHVIMDGETKAETLIKQWRIRTEETKPRDPRDNMPADENSVIELFKYFTKLFVREKDGSVKSYPPEAMDVIFKSIYRRRTVQPFGGVKIVSDEFQDSDQSLELEPGNPTIWGWEQEVATWIDASSGEFLTDRADLIAS